MPGTIVLVDCHALDLTGNPVYGNPPDHTGRLASRLVLQPRPAARPDVPRGLDLEDTAFEALRDELSWTCWSQSKVGTKSMPACAPMSSSRARRSNQGERLRSRPSAVRQSKAKNSSGALEADGMWGWSPSMIGAIEAKSCPTLPSAPWANATSSPIKDSADRKAAHPLLEIGQPAVEGLTPLAQQAVGDVVLATKLSHRLRATQRRQHDLGLLPGGELPILPGLAQGVLLGA
jgi:hypothetical protein